MDRELEIAWAAGLFEGEGTIHSQYGRLLTIALSSTDKDVIDRFHKIAGVGTVSGSQPPKTPRKYIYIWFVGGDNAASLLKELLPYLGERRTADALRCIKSREDYIIQKTSPRPCKWCGDLFRPRFRYGGLQVRCEKCRGKRFHKQKGVAMEPISPAM